MLCFWDYPRSYLSLVDQVIRIVNKIVIVKIKASTASLVNVKNVLRPHIARPRVQDCSARQVAASGGCL